MTERRRHLAHVVRSILGTLPIFFYGTYSCGLAALSAYDWFRLGPAADPKVQLLHEMAALRGRDTDRSRVGFVSSGQVGLPFYEHLFLTQYALVPAVVEMGDGHSLIVVEDPGGLVVKAMLSRGSRVVKSARDEVFLLSAPQ